MNLAFMPSKPLHITTFRRPRTCNLRQRPAFISCLPSSSRNLYQILNIPETPDPKTLSASSIRQAYLKLARIYHPDTNHSDGSDEQFDEIARAWEILSNPELRQIYDSVGEEGLFAVQSISKRAQDIRDRYASISGEQLDYLSDTGQLIGGLLSSGAEDQSLSIDSFDPSSVDHEDACPRSIEEAIWNIQFHEDRSVRYYGLWWIYKFKVSEAETALVNVLRTSDEQTSLGGFGIRRRAALALGTVASAPTEENQDTVLALSDALRSTDYFLRYRAAEALTNIAQRYSRHQDDSIHFSQSVISQLKLILNKGEVEFQRKAENKSGYSDQEGLFDLEKLDPNVREKLEKIFQNRNRNEQKSRRTTMTPQLGVGEVGADAEEPYEWLLKAVSAICSRNNVQDQDLVETVRSYTTNEVPLIRYAAHKALFALTNDVAYAEKIVEALDYGIEHHYSQRVLIRDLGDLGYSDGAAAVACCPMVENSFKILALKNMLSIHDHDPACPAVRDVLRHMDSLL